MSSYLLTSRIFTFQDRAGFFLPNSSRISFEILINFDVIQDRGLNSDYLFSTITANWERKLPVWVMLMIESLTKSDVASRGVPGIAFNKLFLDIPERKQDMFKTCFKDCAQAGWVYGWLRGWGREQWSEKE